MTLDMNTLTSSDGTTIAYDKRGEGPALILVDGALTVHSSGSASELTKLLAPRFTVYGFDRRGRGGSGDTLPYAVDRVGRRVPALAAATAIKAVDREPRREQRGQLRPGAGRMNRQRAVDQDQGRSLAVCVVRDRRAVV